MAGHASASVSLSALRITLPSSAYVGVSDPRTSFRYANGQTRKVGGAIADMRGNQRNLQATLEASLDNGITHIETAKMYGEIPIPLLISFKQYLLVLLGMPR